MRLKYRVLAVDFDGTIAFDAYPQIGGFKPDAERVLKKIKEYGGKIIIWTCRTGTQAYEVEQMLKQAGVKYDAFNDNLEEHKFTFSGDSRKVFADVYIDDRSIHCKEVDWLEIEKLLFIDDGGEESCDNS